MSHWTKDGRAAVVGGTLVPRELLQSIFHNEKLAQLRSYLASKPGGSSASLKEAAQVLRVTTSQARSLFDQANREGWASTDAFDTTILYTP